MNVFLEGRMDECGDRPQVASGVPLMDERPSRGERRKLVPWWVWTLGELVLVFHARDVTESAMVG